jgi:ATP-dependent Clp protease ATP-binding subunit ClpA
VGNLLFLGPTGSGKTRTVEAAAEILFGDNRAVIKVDCAEFQHSHEIAKLIGSPPGYLGHRERGAGFHERQREVFKPQNSFPNAESRTGPGFGSSSLSSASLFSR